MNIEYEATFTDIDKGEIRKKLKAAGATLVKPEFLQSRVVFNFPKGHEIPDAWARVRNEGDKITMSIKIIDGSRMEDQKEIYLEVSNMKDAEKFLATLGCERKAHQENKREVWELHGVEVAIDEWPFLEPFVELEGNSEGDVKAAAKALEFDYSKALFCAVGTLYSKKYDLPEDIINNQTPEIVFGENNPFLRRL